MPGFVNRKLVFCSQYLKRGWQNRGHPYNCTIMGIQDGREGSHKITRENRGKTASRKAIVKREQTEAKRIVDLVFSFW